MREFLVREEDAGQRLDAYLARQLPLRSRAYIQKAIGEGAVTVGSVCLKASYRVASGDIVAMNELEEKPLNLIAENLPLDIVYEDSDLLVINKARGMVVHPSNGHYDGGTLVNALLYHCRDLSSINGVIRPGIVHRIDKDTSGLLVVAKNDRAHLFLQSQLKDKTMFREYLAIAEGRIPHEDAEIIAPIGKDQKDRMKQAVDIYHGKDAVTHVHVAERFLNYTLVECRLETGRTHQIRVHLAYIGHPCVGDKIYGKRSQTLTQSGQMLSAVKLSFLHPSSGERMTFSCEPDAEFVRVLTLIREKNL